jgi:spore coat protein CotH
MQPQPGYDYVPSEEYDTLLGHFGDVDSTLQDVNTLYLTKSFSEFSTNFQNYYPYPLLQGGGGGQ